MPDSPSGYQLFFAELKRRKVFKVMAVYGVVGFGLLQILDLVLPALLLPDWTYRFVVLLLLLGFPIAIGVAWAFEATGDGVRRQQAADPDELHRIIRAPAAHRWPAGLFALGGGALLLWGAWHLGRTSGVDAAAAEIRIAAADTAAGAVVTSIAVLPFADMSAEHDQEYFSDGISEELLNLLAHVPALQVAARTSSFAFKGQEVGIQEIARQLGVAHVLEGSVRKSGDKVRITAQLIRAGDGFHLWSNTWDRTLEDIFAIQDEIAADVAKQLQVTLLGAAPATARPVDPEAYNLVLEARYLQRLGSVDGFQQASELFRQAVEIDSSYADAWVGRAANAYNFGTLGLLGPGESERLAREYVQRALDVDPTHAKAYGLLGAVELRKNDAAGAARYYQRALELDPADDAVLLNSAGLLSDLGRLQEAETMLAHLVERDPVNAGIHSRLAGVLLRSGRYDEAIQTDRRVLSLSPSILWAHYRIANALRMKGEPEAALVEVALEPDEEIGVKMASILHHEMGHRAEHEAAFRELREKWGEEWPSEIAQVYAVKGEADAAFQWLDRAVAQNEDGLNVQYLLSFYDPIRDDPRWQRFLEQSGTTPEQLAAIQFDVPAAM